MEHDLQKRFEAGEFTPEQWRDFWWNERARTLQQVSEMQRDANALALYAERCSSRIEKVTP